MPYVSAQLFLFASILLMPVQSAIQNVPARSRCNALPAHVRMLLLHVLSMMARPVRAQVVTAGVVFSLLLMYSNAACGSCGDYLYRNGRPVSAHHMPGHHMPGQMHDAMSRSTGDFQSDEWLSGSIDQDVVNHSLPVPQHPCHGPNCSQSPSPLAPMPPGVTRVMIDVAILLDSLHAFGGLPEGFAVPRSERIEAAAGASIFHPPEPSVAS